MSEADVQRSIIDYITLIGGVAIRTNSGMRIIEDKNGKERAFRGAPAGTSDVVACIRGHFYAIECKDGKNKATDAQRAFLERVDQAEGSAVLAYSVDDLIQEIAIVDAQADRTHYPPGE